MKASVIVLLGLVMGSAALAADVPPNMALQSEVARGRRSEARASWWGFSAEDATAALQAAINSGARRLIVDKMDGPWIVRPLELADNQELFFEPGVVVLAKAGQFHGSSDALLSAAGRSNIRLIGPGATLRMRRADYDGPAYTHAEWRHVINLHGCRNVTIYGLSLEESGGDGIYLGAGRDGSTNRDIVIRDVVCDRNYRQGISVITAENLLIENCVLKNTAGTAPAAGIDFEPNDARERLVNCVMRNCRIADNQGLALHVYARQFDASTAPLSLRIENCVTTGRNQRSVSLITSCGPKGSVGGWIEVVRCRFEDAGGAGISIGSKSTRGPALRFTDCTLIDTPPQTGEPPPGLRPAKPRPKLVQPPILLSSYPDDAENIGGIDFGNLTIQERVQRPLMKFHDLAELRVVDLRGLITVVRDGRREVVQVDDALVQRLMPYDPVWGIARVPLEKVRLEPVAGGAVAAPDRPAVLQPQPPHRLREGATYLIYARPGETVSMKLLYQTVGRYEARPFTVEITGPDGRRVGQVSVPPAGSAEYAFQAEAVGVYRVHCNTHPHTLRMAACSHPLCIAGEGTVVHFLATAGEFYFLVPGGTRSFGVRVWGESEGERVTATICNPAGQAVWTRENIGTPQSFLCETASAADAVWKLKLARPTVAVFEDHFVELRGVPSLLALRPESLLRPRREE